MPWGIGVSQPPKKNASSGTIAGTSRNARVFIRVLYRNASGCAINGGPARGTGPFLRAACARAAFHPRAWHKHFYTVAIRGDDLANLCRDRPGGALVHDLSR